MNHRELEVSNDFNFIDEALILHNKIFKEDGKTIYNSKEEWVKRISEGGYFVFCKVDLLIVGYAVCDVIENGDLKIWLAGVDPEFRKRGIWSLLYENIKQHAKNEGRVYILLNTFPSKFPAMYSFLKSIHADIYKTEMVNGEEKFYAKIPI